MNPNHHDSASKSKTFMENRLQLNLEYHIAREIRDAAGLSSSLFSITGSTIFSTFHDVRVFTENLRSTPELARQFKVIDASDLNAMGLIDEIFHFIITKFMEANNSNVFQQALVHLEGKFSQDQVNAFLSDFVDHFPPNSVYEKTLSAEDYLKSHSKGIPNRAIALEELLILYLDNKNPAYSPYKALFDDHHLDQQQNYKRIISGLYDFFDSQPSFGPDNQKLIDMLRSPALLFPDSLTDQLNYIKTHWGFLLGDFLLRLLSALDFIKEEKMPRFGGGPGENPIPDYKGRRGLLEYEKYSQDKHWMPKVVLMAKSSLVWLSQLSKQYQREITRLDQVPDEELDRLSEQGFTGLWLIGLWQRSSASRKIKQSYGNPEAEASAYSLYDYEIADSLGGWPALENLKHRCLMRGIKLASDMVPNHTGLESNWVINKPDYFIQTPYPPFPGYTYNSQNLSDTDGVGIYLEDHYYDRTDAAVTFKRVDFNTGDTRYIYHGNDGTHMPWNDTAQLNFLNPEAREAVIQAILHVARNFQIIRFDAAMTLAKMHIQRLWFPEPGSGGDIPSRSEHALSAEDFDKLIPEEFWREVVDRVEAEGLDTLLLAEAFWMMEGYFVRTLGMHRVYNSAFMNMLKDEENEKYKWTIKNTLEFDPRILKRFVNFMNNPDEETAAEQFGKGDKYFGVCTLMATMPGLPMFGHGQIEGYYEKYGMEYSKAYWDEHPDEGFISEHYRRIFPLLRKRYLFAEVENFLLFDFHRDHHNLDHNVFAYFNRAGNETALVFYNNSYHSTQGWIKESSGYLTAGDKDEKHLVSRSLSAALNLDDNRDNFVRFYEHNSGLHYLRRSSDLIHEGLYGLLQGYECQVYLNFEQIRDNEHGHYNMLFHHLGGRGVPDLDTAMEELLYRPLHETVQRLLTIPAEEENRKEKLTGIYKDLLQEIPRIHSPQYPKEISPEDLTKIAVDALKKAQKIKTPAKPLLKAVKTADQIDWEFCLNTAALLSPLCLLAENRSDWTEFYRQWRLSSPVIQYASKNLEGNANQTAEMIPVIGITTGQNLTSELLCSGEIQTWLKVNEFQGTRWFNKEYYDLLVLALYLTNKNRKKLSAEWPKSMIALGEKAEYRFEDLQNLIEKSVYSKNKAKSETSSSK